jgi:hypothetical protein
MAFRLRPDFGRVGIILSSVLPAVKTGIRASPGISVVERNYHGDAFTSRIVRR